MGTIGFHDLSNLVQAIQQNAINLVGRDDDVASIAFGTDCQIMKSFLGQIDLLLRLSSDEHLILLPSDRSGRHVTEDMRKERREVNGGVRSRFDLSDVLADSAANDVV